MKWWSILVMAMVTAMRWLTLVMAMVTARRWLTLVMAMVTAMEPPITTTCITQPTSGP